MLKTERPQGRKRRETGQPCVGAKDLLGIRAVENIVIDWAALGAKRIEIAFDSAEIETCGPGVVQEESGGTATTHRDKEGNAFVDGIGGFLEEERIRIPEAEGLSTTIKRSNGVAKSKVVFVWRHFLEDAKRASVGFHGPASRVFLKHIALQVRDAQSKRGAIDADAQRLGVKTNRIGSGFRRDFNVHVADLHRNRPRSIFRQFSRDRLAHPKDAIA